MELNTNNRLIAALNDYIEMLTNEAGFSNSENEDDIAERMKEAYKLRDILEMKVPDFGGWVG